MANKKLRNSLKKFSGQKEEKLVTITGELGIPLGGQKIVEVPGRNGFVYVRLKSNTSEIIQAYNSEVSTIYGLPVLVARQGNIYKVIGRNLDRYRDWSDIPYLPKHGGQHSFNFSLGMGADVTWVYSQQFMPLLSYPSGTQGSMVLALEPHFYEWQGQWRYAQNTGTPSYTPYLPTITGSARMVLSYIDPSDNSIKLVAGTPFSNSLTGSAQIAPYIPDIPRSVGIPLAAVRLVTGTTAIGWGNIYDMRDFYTVNPSITGSTFGGIAVQDEGIPLGTGTTFNFVGTNVSATISGSVVRIFVTGSSGGGGHTIQWEGTPFTNRSNLNFVGNGVGVIDDSGNNATIVSISGTTPADLYNLIWNAPEKPVLEQFDKWPIADSDTNTLKSIDYDSFLTQISGNFDPYGAANPPITGSVVYRDDGVLRGSALVFNFRNGILATASGTTAEIDLSIENSTSVLGSAITLTGTSGVYQDTGLSVTLPNAGVYELNANVRGSLQGGTGSVWWLVAKLFNVTDATDVANSERLIVLTDTTGKNFQMTCPIDIPVTVAAGKTINLYATRKGVGGTSWTISTIESNSDGRTTLSYKKIGSYP